MTHTDIEALQAQADYYEEEAQRQPTERNPLRDRAEHDIEQLYGYTGEWLEKLIEHFGSLILSDDAVIYLAALQRAYDERPR